MSDWLAQSPAILASVLVIFGPGALVGVAFGLRGLTLWAFAPVISTALLTSSATVLGFFGIGWRPLPALVSIGVVAGVVAAVRLALRLAPLPERHISLRPERLLLVVGIAVGVVLTAGRVGLYIVAPDAISQTNDGSFHLNALRFAVETGSASPLKLTEMIGASSFYPSGWHVLASLVPQVTGASVEVAANTVSLVVAAGVWPLGVALLARVIGGTIAASVAAGLAAAVPAFPLLMVQWGILYPQLLAVSVLPASLAVVALWSPLTAGSGSLAGRSIRAAALLGVGVAAILFSQPSVVLAWAVAAFVFLCGRIARRWKVRSRTQRALAVAAAFAVAVIIAGVWWFFGRSIAGTWPPSTGKALAVAEVVVNGYLGYPWAVGTSCLMLIGIVEGVRRARLRWLVAAWLAFSGLYIVAAAVGFQPLRSLLVGPWYEDPYRLAAMLPVVVLPLAGIGAAVVVRWAVSAGARLSVASWVAIGTVAAVECLSLLVAPQIARRDVFAHRIDPNLYTITAHSFLSQDELAVLQKLDQLVDRDAIVIGNPSTGMSFGYAISGRNVIPRTWQPPPGPEYEVLWASLRDAASDPAVCPALNAFGARYVLDFGPGEQYPGRWIMPGFDDLDGQPGFKLVDREGDASLWLITACD